MPFLFLSLPLSLFFAQYLFLSPLCWFKSYWWTWLLFLQSPCSNSLTCCLIDGVLVCTHWAFDYRHPPPSASATHTHSHTDTKHHLCMVGAKAKAFFFPSDSCDLCLLTKISKETRQGGIIPHDSFFSFTVLSLDTHIPCKDTHTYITYNNNTQTHTKMWPCAHALAHAHPLLCSHTVHRGVHSYRLRSLTDAGFFRPIPMLMFENNKRSVI